MNILEMCMYVFDGAIINYNISNLDIFDSFLHCRVWSLCNHLLLQFLVDVSQTC